MTTTENATPEPAQETQDDQQHEALEQEPAAPSDEDQSTEEPEGDEPTEDEAPGEQSSPEPATRKLKDEAQKLRKRLRETEEQLEAARASVRTLKATVIDELAGVRTRPDGTAAPGITKILALDGIDATDLVSDDGTIDRRKLFDLERDVAQNYGIKFGGFDIPTPRGRSNNVHRATWKDVMTDNS